MSVCVSVCVCVCLCAPEYVSVFISVCHLNLVLIPDTGYFCYCCYRSSSLLSSLLMFLDADVFLCICADVHVWSFDRKTYT